MIKYNKQNWNECLDSLGFKEAKNNNFGGIMILDDKGIPQWQYNTEEEKEKLYYFFSGAVYWQIHKCISCERK